MRVSILTNSGAVIHSDPDDATQSAMLPVAITALGGELVRTEIPADEATA